MADAPDRGREAILTIGHSTRTLESFIGLLGSNGVRLVVDVRTVPGSRRNPQFNREPLEESLHAAGIAYLPMKGLGGLRRPRPDSPNAAWRNASFRGFADYMQTDEFEQNIQELIRQAAGTRIALMCAEAVPWRCHRSLIADALAARGLAVAHIIDDGPPRPHSVTPWARVEGSRITYPG